MADRFVIARRNYIAISVRHTATWQFSLAAIALALILLTACVTAPEPQPTVALDPTPRPTPGPISRNTRFVPLDEPAYVTRENASPNITNDSYVLGVANNGEARAYPIDMMRYHHIANDTVGGEPWLVSY